MLDRFGEIGIELLSEGYTIRFRATGESMSPTIKNGEMIAVRPLGIGRIRLGAIVLYQSERGPIAHRVVNIKGRRHGHFILRGDAAQEADPPVLATQLLGEVTYVEGDKKNRRLSGGLFNYYTVYALIAHCKRDFFRIARNLFF